MSGYNPILSYKYSFQMHVTIIHLFIDISDILNI